MAIRITCINKSNGYHEDPHHAIERLGWVNEQTGERRNSSRIEIYNWLQNKANVAYVVDSRGNRANVFPRDNGRGTHFLQTFSDGIWTDNLLALPECR